ncbi:MAG: hypothetical protein K2X39_09230 [Silvanigrellaceae bacterium]|nr:hypothetical protein [Silvanigrellaceae bacterium]
MIKIEGDGVYIEETFVNTISEKTNRDKVDLFINQKINFTNTLNVNTPTIETQIGTTLNHSYGIGLGVYFIPSSIKYKGSTYQNIIEVTNSFAYTFIPGSLFHPKVELGAGGGSVQVTNSSAANKVNYFIFAKLFIGAEVNITHYLRAGFGLGYKYNLVSQCSEYLKKGNAFDLGVSVLFKTF